MPRTVHEILAHADELADRFEDCEPGDATELNAVAFMDLRHAVQARADAERLVGEAVAQAREVGFSWRDIGGVLGTSGEAARQRYGCRHPA